MTFLKNIHSFQNEKSMGCELSLKIDVRFINCTKNDAFRYNVYVGNCLDERKFKKIP